ncbi:Tn3 family transposase [Streptomyces sp. NPDC004069]
MTPRTTTADPRGIPCGARPSTYVCRAVALLTNAVTFHNALDIAEIVRQLLEEGWTIEPEDLAHISPYLTEHINRFGEYSTHELGIQPDAYGPKLDVDFTQLRDDNVTAEGFGQAA